MLRMELAGRRKRRRPIGCGRNVTNEDAEDEKRGKRDPRWPTLIRIDERTCLRDCVEVEEEEGNGEDEE